MTQTPQQLLLQYFGYNSFRPLQLDIINSVLAGKDTLALLPTGGGKSVCYQIPALAMPGICLVITPLIALMNDQVNQLRRRNISALAIHSGLNFFEVKKALETSSQNLYKFLFVSPERLQTPLFKEYLPGLPINLIAVDEAHCINAWGYDFRPPYLKIADLRLELDHVPMLALTASATKAVQNDICEKLQLVQPNIFKQSFEKPNLSFSCFNTTSKFQKLLSILQHVPGSALIYCRNRRRTKDIATLLAQHQINCSYYHAGLDAATRNTRQADWISNKTPVMACTNAFGMGIDKPDVRTVVHIDVPDNPEAYYQEAGRAGRDGKKAYAVLLFTDDELAALEKMPAQKFPPIDVVRKMYVHICNYLQIPVYSGQGNYYDFDLVKFCDAFKHEPVAVSNAMQTLQQAGYISYNASVFLPAKVGFTVQKNYLFDFENTNPNLEPLIKTLLRTYEGIFDNTVSVSEKLLAKLLQTTEAQIVQNLVTLAQHKIIDYTPKKDTPQIYFLYERIPELQLSIDMTLYAKRRSEYVMRIKEIIHYATNTKTCRSVVLRQYFADETEIKNCGICDVCLNKKSKPILTESQLKLYAQQAITLLPQHPTIETFKQKIKLPHYQLVQLIDYLLAEEIMLYGHDGQLVLQLNKKD